MKKLLPVLLLFICSFSNAQIYSAAEYIGIDQDQLDAFGRLQTGEPKNQLNSQFYQDLQPLLWDTITVGTGTSVVHESTDRHARLLMNSTPLGSKVGMQTFEYFTYYSGIAQNVDITFNMRGGSPSVDKVVGYTDGVNGIEFLMDETIPTFRVKSGTSGGDHVVAQSAWTYQGVNDRFDGTGKSGINLDFTKAQILVMDFQALYVGRVRIGFNVDGQTRWAHEFDFANSTEVPYFQTANLPVSAYMINAAVATDTLDLICSTVISSGGIEADYAYVFAKEYTATAASGADEHVVSLQPVDIFAGQINRGKFELLDVEVINTGANDVRVSVVVGQAISGGTAADVNATYSIVEQITGGTLSGSPSFMVGGTYAVAGIGSASSGSSGVGTRHKIPFTLDHEGLQRLNGRMSILAFGIGGTSTIRVITRWKEIR